VSRRDQAKRRIVIGRQDFDWLVFDFFDFLVSRDFRLEIRVINHFENGNNSFSGIPFRFI